MLLESVVAPLRTDAFGWRGPLPKGANPDVVMFIADCNTDNRPIPIGAAVLGEVGVSKVLASKVAEKDKVVGQTWATARMEIMATRGTHRTVTPSFRGGGIPIHIHTEH